MYMYLILFHDDDSFIDRYMSCYQSNRLIIFYRTKDIQYHPNYFIKNVDKSLVCLIPLAKLIANSSNLYNLVSGIL